MAQATARKRKAHRMKLLRDTTEYGVAAVPLCILTARHIKPVNGASTIIPVGVGLLQERAALELMHTNDASVTEKADTSFPEVNPTHSCIPRSYRIQC